MPFLVLLPIIAHSSGPDAAAGAIDAADAVALLPQYAPDFIESAPLATIRAAQDASSSAATLLQTFLPTAARSLGLLGGIILFGRIALRRVFATVASTGSHDAFVAACLLTVCGTAVATDQAGFGQELGAFLAGVLLAESSFRPQVRTLGTLGTLCAGSAQRTRFRCVADRGHPSDTRGMRRTFGYAACCVLRSLQGLCVRVPAACCVQLLLLGSRAWL